MPHSDKPCWAPLGRPHRRCNSKSDQAWLASYDNAQTPRRRASLKRALVALALRGWLPGGFVTRLLRVFRLEAE